MITNAILEGVIAGAIVYNYTPGFLWGFGAGTAVAGLSFTMRFTFSFNKPLAVGSLLTCLPFYVTIYSIAAGKAIARGIIEPYVAALKEEQQKRRLPAPEQNLRLKTSSRRNPIRGRYWGVRKKKKSLI